MYMSRLTLQDDAALSVVARAGGDGYGIHQSLWRLFEDDPAANRDFLYRQEAGHGRPRFLMVSRRQPLDREGLWRVESKEYQPQLEHGQRLGFSLRVSPVVTRRDEAGRQRRHDVVMDLKRQESAHDNEASQADLVQQAVWDWLERRFGRLGFTVEPETFLADGYRQHELRKRSGHPIRFSAVDCHGVLTITDPEVLIDVLSKGIGPAKAFGCGLLLVRRV